MRKWTLKEVHEEALKFNTKIEFKKGSPIAYWAAQRMKIVPQISGHMTPLRHKWTFEELVNEALKVNRNRS